MTKAKFVVSITASYMTIEVLQRKPGGGLQGVWRRWIAYLHGQEDPNYRVVESISVHGNSNSHGLAILFQKGLDALKKSPRYVLAGSSLEVVLGPTLSRVDILEMVSDGGAKLSDTDKQSYVEAWISQTWKLQPIDCVVCRVSLGKSDRHLVTCIENHVVEVIHSLCGQEHVQLSSCKPALALHLTELLNDGLSKSSVDTAVNSTAQAFSVFTERAIDGGRTPIVQFVSMDHFGPKSVTRMWLARDDNQGVGSQVDRVIDRLRAQHRCHTAPRIHATHWPPVHVHAAKP